MDESRLTKTASSFAASCNLNIETVMNHLHVRNDWAGGQKGAIEVRNGSFANLLPSSVCKLGT
jgi:hypothetical protein